MLYELFDLSPIGLRPYGKIDGQTIESNEDIQNFIKNWIATSQITKNISNKIIEGMDNGHLIVGYESGKLSFLKSRWRDVMNKGPEKGYLGYYSTKENKIAITLDENATVMGKAIREIPPILTHELIHMCAYNRWKMFLMVSMNKFLIPYYKEVFTKLDSNLKKIKNRTLMETIIDISRISDHRFNGPPDMMKIFDTWFRLLRTYVGEDKAEQYTANLMSPYQHFVLRDLPKNKVKDVMKYATIIGLGYKKIGISDIFKLTVPCQEMMFPSEVMCMSNEFNPSNEIIKVINTLDLGRK